MNKRPVSVTVISFIFLAAGLAGLIYHLPEWKTPHPFQHEILWVTLIRLLAIVCGVYMFRGSNWARWLAVIWIGYHVILSVFHPIMELAVHALLFAAIAYFLFRRQSTEYFQAAAT
jgi:hypothetical protein